MSYKLGKVIMEYKSYTGTVNFSEEDGVFHGKVLDVTASISYEGTTMEDLIKDFHDAIDEYLEAKSAKSSVLTIEQPTIGQ